MHTSAHTHSLYHFITKHTLPGGFESDIVTKPTCTMNKFTKITDLGEIYCKLTWKNECGES